MEETFSPGVALSSMLNAAILYCSSEIICQGGRPAGLSASLSVSKIGPHRSMAYTAFFCRSPFSTSARVDKLLSVREEQDGRIIYVSPRAGKWSLGLREL